MECDVSQNHLGGLSSTFCNPSAQGLEMATTHVSHTLRTILSAWVGVRVLSNGDMVESNYS